MDYFKKNRLMTAAMLTLVVLNLALLITIWYPRLLKPAAEVPATTPAPVKQTVKQHPKQGDNRPPRPQGRERQEAQMARFFQEELKFSTAQMKKYRELRKKFFQEAEAARGQSTVLRRSVMEQLFNENIDTGKVTQLAQAFGDKHRDAELLHFNHFLEIMSICDAQQKKAFRGLLHEIMDMMKPPEHRAPPGQGRRPPPPGDGQAPPRPPGDSRRQGPPPQSGDSRQQGVPPRSGDFRQQGPPPQSGDSRRQGPPGQGLGPGNRVDNQIRRMTTALGLSTTQAEKIRPLIQKAHEQLEQNRTGNRNLGHHERRLAHQKIDETRDRQIEALLTPAQKERYQKFKRETRPPRQGPPPR